MNTLKVIIHITHWMILNIMYPTAATSITPSTTVLRVRSVTQKSPAATVSSVIYYIILEFCASVRVSVSVIHTGSGQWACAQRASWPVGALHGHGNEASDC